jgi:hypothetical protein
MPEPPLLRQLHKKKQAKHDLTSQVPRNQCFHVLTSRGGTETLDSDAVSVLPSCAKLRRGRLAQSLVDFDQVGAVVRHPRYGRRYGGSASSDGGANRKARCTRQG